MNDIRPITVDCGRPINVGFSSYTPIEDMEKTYDYVKIGHYHNYFFTTSNWHLPSTKDFYPEYVIDAFSPNLNKNLHVGHLRQLVLAASLYRLLPKSKFVAILGCALGVMDGAASSLRDWMDFVGYKPEIHYDKSFSDYSKEELLDGKSDQKGCKVWLGPNGPVIMVRSDGNPTYSLHDLLFAKEIKPTHYITGAEQEEHFANLGFKNKHLPMGLVLGTDKKKMKSRTGEALSAVEALQMAVERLKETPNPKKLAWNVLAWNFLHVNRAKNILFDVEKWTSPDAPGLYISYSYGRIHSALAKAPKDEGEVELLPADINILGWAEYKRYWQLRSQELLDPAPYANYLHDLARVLGNAYHEERIKDGRPGFRYAIRHAHQYLGDGMRHLGMFPLEEV